MRRLILLLSVGWLPPYVPPSGACLCLGSRVLSQPLNAVEGSTTPGLRLCRCTLVPLLRAWVNPRSLLGVRCDGPLSGHGPGHDSGVFAACHEAPVTLTAPHVGFPPDGLEALGVCCEAQGPMAADFRGIARGPGAFAEDASGMGVAPQRSIRRGPSPSIASVLLGDHTVSEYPWPPPGVRPPGMARHTRPAEPRPPGTNARLTRAPGVLARAVGGVRYAHESRGRILEKRFVAWA
jgi:hypothetical protein